MAQYKITPGGTLETTVPASQSIFISNYGGGIADIYYLLTPANYPQSYQFQQNLDNSSVTLGPFSTAQGIKINANNSTVVYSIATTPDTGVGDADTLGGQAPAYYTNAGNMDAGTLSDARLPGTITSDITGNAATATTAAAIDGTTDIDVNKTTPVIKLTESSDGRYLQFLISGGQNLIQSANSGGAAGDLIYFTGPGGAPAGPFYSNEDNVTQQFWNWSNSDEHYSKQAAPIAQTTDDTLTAAELNTRIITVDQGAAGTSTQTLPLATEMDSYFTTMQNDSGFEFSVINISTVAAEDCTIATNTGWTLVGSMVIESYDDPRARSTGRFFARKTGAGAWTLYRIA